MSISNVTNIKNITESQNPSNTKDYMDFSEIVISVEDENGELNMYLMHLDSLMPEVCLGYCD
jgi:hypothetical protein